MIYFQYFKLLSLTHVHVIPNPYSFFSSYLIHSIAVIVKWKQQFYTSIIKVVHLTHVLYSKSSEGIW